MTEKEPTKNTTSSSKKKHTPTILPTPFELSWVYRCYYDTSGRGIGETQTPQEQNATIQQPTTVQKEPKVDQASDNTKTKFARSILSRTRRKMKQLQCSKQDINRTLENVDSMFRKYDSVFCKSLISAIDIASMAKDIDLAQLLIRVYEVVPDNVAKTLSLVAKLDSFIPGWTTTYQPTIADDAIYGCLEIDGIDKFMVHVMLHHINREFNGVAKPEHVKMYSELIEKSKKRMFKQESSMQQLMNLMKMMLNANDVEDLNKLAPSAAV